MTFFRCVLFYLLATSMQFSCVYFILHEKFMAQSPCLILRLHCCCLFQFSRYMASHYICAFDLFSWYSFYVKFILYEKVLSICWDLCSSLISYNTDTLINLFPDIWNQSWSQIHQQERSFLCLHFITIILYAHTTASFSSFLQGFHLYL